MRKILIILGILVLGGVVFYFFRPKTTSYSPTPLPKIELSFVKGMYLPSALAPARQPMAEPARLKELGVNLVAFTVEYKVNEKGEQQRDPWGIVASKGQNLDERVISTIRKYKEAGFAVLVVPRIRYLPKGRGEPLGIPENLQNDPKFFEGFNKFVLHLAEIAQKENVEFFTPADEPDYTMGPFRAATWMQEILPQVRARFKGKLVYKGGFSPPGEISWFNFAGYDIAGTTIVVLDYYNEEQYRKMAKKQIADLAEVAQKRDKVPEIWVSGFGVVEMTRNPLNENQKADIYRIVFEEAVGKTTGLIPWENPPNPLKDTLMEKVIREWFTKI
ncbi:MAG: glycoside hydrolase family 113 [Patescibacteria group bacterium]